MMFIWLSNKPDMDKKESVGEWGRVGVGLGIMAVGIGLFFVPGVNISAPLILAVGALWAFAGGSLVGGIAGLLTPDSVIPGWVWIVGVGFLLFMVMKKK